MFYLGLQIIMRTTLIFVSELFNIIYIRLYMVKPENTSQVHDFGFSGLSWSDQGFGNAESECVKLHI